MNQTARSATDLPFLLVGSVAASCFIGGLVLDVVYWQWPDFLWVTFSVWLITIGLVVALVAVVVGVIDRAVRPHVVPLRMRWPYLLGFFAVAVVSIFNAFVHSRDAYLAVVPQGLALSAVAVALLILTPIVARTLHPRGGEVLR